MQKAKRLLFIASIFELALAGLFLIVDIIYSSEWLASINGNQTVNIIITVSLFVIAMMLTVDGILTLRYSKADDEVAKKCQRARLFAGIVFIVLTIASFVVNWFLEQSNIMELVSDVTVISFLLFIVMAVLNLCGSSAMNKKSKLIIYFRKLIMITVIIYIVSIPQFVYPN